jgi:hypothetical protein
LPVERVAEFGILVENGVEIRETPASDGLPPSAATA